MGGEPGDEVDHPLIDNLERAGTTFIRRLLSG
jgi:hypothetical protein